jgi:DNA-binding NarL/FixJ family response regulator
MQTATLELKSSGADRAVSAKRRIFIVDDHPIFRLGLSKLIGLETDLTVCGEASNTVQALDALRHIEADAVVVDISLPGANGIELVKSLRAEHSRLPILVLSAHDEKLYALRALRAGASGFLMKRESENSFVPALRSVLAGKIWVSPSFGQQLIYKIASGSSENGGGSPLDALTDRELEILHLVGEGKATSQIAESLHLSVKTVECHRLHVKEKLNLETAGELARFAVEWVGQQEG